MKTANSPNKPWCRLTAEAEGDGSEAIKMRVYEQRLYAETMIGRPTMKAFKAMLRAEGLIGSGKAGE